ncbi:MAG: class I SAM-dependent methyltransferase [Planctomycetota bacterium]
MELDASDSDGPLRRIAESVRDSVLLHCNDCHLLVRWPQLSESDLTDLYSNLPTKYWDYDVSKVGSWKTAKDVLLKRFDRNQSIQILDVGAFDGSFLQTLPETWEKFAIEPSSAASQQLRASGIPCLAPFVESLSLHEHAGTFDAITLFDVFEHLPNPNDTLRRLTNLLRPGGRLLISTGNSDHWSWRLLGASHWYLHSVQHLCVGSQQFFKRWAQNEGVEVEFFQAHPHQLGGQSIRLRQSLETIHAWARQKNRTRLMGLIHLLPGMKHLVHKTSSPFSNTLHDHGLVVLHRRAIESDPSTRDEVVRSCSNS